MMTPVNFGKTPYKVNRLGFGAMHLPRLASGRVDFKLSTPLLRFALEHGVNFIDSHHFYHDGESEEAIGKALAGIPRDRVILQTKIGMYNDYTEKACWKLLELALKKMKTDYIDFYFAHSLRLEDWRKYGKLFMRFTGKALKEGKIRYRGFSSHDDSKNIKKYINSGEFSAMLVQYNILDRHNEEVIALACAKGLGVEVMGPLAGGMLGFPGEKIRKFSPVKVKSAAELALKFVLANPNVHVALSGMTTIPQARENIAAASSASELSPAKIRRLDEAFEDRKKLLDLYCTGCGYCLPCPKKVNIPRIFRLYNLAQVYGLEKRAGRDYRALNPTEKASRCLACGKCEKKCPQKIPIRERLKQIGKYFEKPGPRA